MQDNANESYYNRALPCTGRGDKMVKSQKHRTQTCTEPIQFNVLRRTSLPWNLLGQSEYRYVTLCIIVPPSTTALSPIQTYTQKTHTRMQWIA